MQTALRFFFVALVVVITFAACDRPVVRIAYSGELLLAVKLCEANPQQVSAEVVINLRSGIPVHKQIEQLRYLERHGCLRRVAIKSHGPTDEEYDVYHRLKRAVVAEVTIV